MMLQNKQECFSLVIFKLVGKSLGFCIYLLYQILISCNNGLAPYWLPNRDYANLTTVSFPGFSGGRRDSMDRNSQTAFSPSLIDQYNKNKPGWPNYGPLGNPAGNFYKAAPPVPLLLQKCNWSIGSI
jgi:hypothetical protein